MSKSWMIVWAAAIALVLPAMGHADRKAKDGEILVISDELGGDSTEVERPSSGMSCDDSGHCVPAAPDGSDGDEGEEGPEPSKKKSKGKKSKSSKSKSKKSKSSKSKRSKSKSSKKKH